MAAIPAYATKVAPKWPTIALSHHVPAPASCTTRSATIPVINSWGIGGPAMMNPLVTSVQTRPVAMASGEHASACTDTWLGSAARTIAITATDASHNATVAS